MAMRGQENEVDFGLGALRQAASRLIGQNAVLLNQRPRSLQPAMDEHLALMSAPKLGSPFRKGDGRIGPVAVRGMVGKIVNAPNTALGLAYGSVGHAVGEIRHAVAPKRYPERPSSVVGDNAVQFRDNPGGGVSAITIGNTTAYSPGYADPATIQHEKQHTYQGEQLGPGYLPSNLLGGLTALFHDRDKRGVPDWHGQHNWNERGPQMDPPQPWPDGGRR